MLNLRRALILIFFLLPIEDLLAAKTSLNPFDFATKIQSIFKKKNYSELQLISTNQAKLTEQEFMGFYIKPASEDIKNGPTLSRLLIGADHIYIQSGKAKNGKIGGIIFFITLPKIKVRKQWLIDYAACAFKTENNALVLVEGFCFLGTDGAPKLDPPNVAKTDIPEGRR